MPKSKKELLAEIDREGEKLERWLQRLNLAVTKMNNVRHRLKYLHKRLSGLARDRAKAKEEKAGRVPIIPEQTAPEYNSGQYE